MTAAPASTAAAAARTQPPAMWVKATASGSSVQLEYAGLARGEDPAIAVAVAELKRTHEASLDSEHTSAR